MKKKHPDQLPASMLLKLAGTRVRVIAHRKVVQNICGKAAGNQPNSYIQDDGHLFHALWLAHKRGFRWFWPIVARETNGRWRICKHCGLAKKGLIILIADVLSDSSRTSATDKLNSVAQQQIWSKLAMYSSPNRALYSGSCLQITCSSNSPWAYHEMASALV